MGDAAGADLGTVLVVGDVADPVQPVPGAGREAMLVAGRSARRWCPMPNKFMAAPLSSSIA